MSEANAIRAPVPVDGASGASSGPVIPDGYVSPGLGALARLADAADGNDGNLHGT